MLALLSFTSTISRDVDVWYYALTRMAKQLLAVRVVVAHASFFLYAMMPTLCMHPRVCGCIVFSSYRFANVFFLDTAGVGLVPT